MIGGENMEPLKVSREEFPMSTMSVTGMIPMTGVPLLFVSNGGSSLIAAMCAIGVAQAIIARMNSRNIKEQL